MLIIRTWITGHGGAYLRMHDLRQTPQVPGGPASDDLFHMPQAIPVKCGMCDGPLRLRRLPQRGPFDDRGGLPLFLLTGPLRHTHRVHAPARRAYARTGAPHPRWILHPDGIPQRRERHRSARCAEGDVSPRRTGARGRMRILGSMRGRGQLRNRVQHHHGIIPHVGGVLGSMQHDDLDMSRRHRILRRTQMLQARRISRGRSRDGLHQRVDGRWHGGA